MVTGPITKPVPLTTSLHKPEGGKNPYVQFEYGPLTICNHTRVHISAPMNADTINMMHTNQQSSK